MKKLLAKLHELDSEKIVVCLRAEHPWSVRVWVEGRIEDCILQSLSRIVRDDEDEICEAIDKLMVDVRATYASPEGLFMESPFTSGT